MNRSTAMKQAVILTVLREADRPLTSEEISKRITGRFHVAVDNITIGVNLGYMRRAGEAKFVSCLTGMRRVGRRTYPNVTRYWFHGSLPNEYGANFKRELRRRNEARYQATLPLHRRRRKRPITDDMRQMVEDLQVTA